MHAYIEDRGLLTYRYTISIIVTYAHRDNLLILMFFPSELCRRNRGRDLWRRDPPGLCSLRTHNHPLPTHHLSSLGAPVNIVGSQMGMRVKVDTEYVTQSCEM